MLAQKVRYSVSTRSAAVVKGLIAIAALACLSLSGCEDPTIWSASARSTDGNWLSTARTIQHGGFGNDGVETIVEIKQNGARAFDRVLAFDNGGASIDLKMTWVTPSHLEVFFRGDPKALYYQVVKTSGVEISVRNAQLSGGNPE